MIDKTLVAIARDRSHRYQQLARAFSPPAWPCDSRLSREYTRLFVAPRPLVYPYESMHRDPCPRVMGDFTLDVIRCYREAGFRVSDAWRDLPDHVALELHFMSTLAEAEAQRWRGGEDEPAGAVARRERRFLEDHLLPWVPEFCDAVLRASRLKCFRRAVDHLRNVLPRDHDWLLALTAGSG